MKISTTNNAKNPSIDSINLALTRAQNVSKRSGIGWSLMDSQESLLKCDAIITGLDRNKLARAIREYQNILDHLFISIEPIADAFDVAELIDSINFSHCSQITIGHRHIDSYADKTWRDWEKDWNGKIHYLSPNTIAKNLGFGITNVKKHQRPWVIAISAANFTGISLPLQNFIHEFGFISYLATLVQQNRALLYSSSQQELIASLPDCNFMEEPLELYEVFEKNNINSILQYCAREHRCSVIVLCDMSLLAYLINNDLVDEIVHHITNIDGDLSSRDSQEVNTITQTFFNLNDWKLLSSSVAGNCSRIVLRKQLATTEPELALKRGLN